MRQDVRRLLDRDLLSSGSYARNQLFSRDRLIAWSHRSRFERARELTKPYQGRRLLDYGCGDGTFLVLVHDLFPDAVGVDADPKQVAECARRLTSLQGLSFMLTDELRTPRHATRYDVVVCMEVLEHCLETVVDEVAEDLRRLITPEGMVLISVPIETGPSLIVKEFVRLVAAWRRLGDYQYRERYTLGELATMLFATHDTSIPRPVYRQDFEPARPNIFHTHKGFNWRRLRRQLTRYFVIHETCFSPFGWLGGYANSQVWFTCKPRTSG